MRSDGFQDMHSTHREMEILDELKVSGSCRIQDLARRLDVSEETIRRNVKKLAGRGLVRKVHGGVYLPDAVQEAPFAQRMDENPDAKRLIAGEVARMIKNGDSLILDIGSTTAIEQIVALFERGRGPCQIDFEVTETAAMRDLKQANQSLLILLGLGARIALDDFGTGHSSLTHVQKLPLHRIKIDRSFVAEVTNDIASRAIVKTMVDLCRNLGISCVFEGVETEEQLQALIALGGTVMQGYFFGRPMAVDEVETYLRRERTPVQREGRAAG